MVGFSKNTWLSDDVLCLALLKAPFGEYVFFSSRVLEGKSYVGICRGFVYLFVCFLFFRVFLRFLSRVSSEVF